MSNDILDELETLIRDAAQKRMSFLMAVTKSSRSISEGANQWFEAEIKLLEDEMKILARFMPGEVSEWNKRLESISGRFKKAINFLNGVIEKAEKGELTSIGEVRPPEKATFPPKPAPIIDEEKEEEELDLISAILEVFDSASTLEKLIDEVEKESKRAIQLTKLAIEALKEKKRG